MTDFNPNQFSGTDSERIEQALAALKAQGGGKIVISRRDDADGRDFWLIDRAILLDSNTTLVIDNCTVKLSDQARDNFIRSANCGIGIQNVAPLHDIHVLGIGNAVLQGADHPRSTGDSAKTIGRPSTDEYPVRTYGTDKGKDGESQQGDWRNIGVLLAYVKRFSVCNITIRDSHCWAMSHEHCTDGLLSHLHFESAAGKTIDGVWETMLNQDGIDLRQGCHRITIENITGYTGDDLVALTAINAGKGGEAGRLNTTMVAGTLPTDDDDISHIIIRDVLGHSEGRCQIIRFLNTGGCKIHDIILENVVDTSSPETRANVTVRIGDSLKEWGGVTPLGDTYNFIINNIHSYSRECILIPGSLSESSISNVFNHNPDTVPLNMASGQEYTRNLILTNLRTF